jgi:streptomycin 6-kinase
VIDMQLSDRVRSRALAHGKEGSSWIANLSSMVADLAGYRSLTVERSYSGGSEAFVADVRMSDGRDAVLKIVMPWLDAARSEFRTLVAARGRGYAEVFACDEPRSAILLERLGPRLCTLGLSVDAQIAAICETLRIAWMPVPAQPLLMTGRQKAVALASFIENVWHELGKPCQQRTIEVALTFAATRSEEFNFDNAVFAHGDPHAGNLLLVSNDGSERYKFVDPDGLIIERAYDLGICMREWSDELLADDPISGASFGAPTYPNG